MALPQAVEAVVVPLQLDCVASGQESLPPAWHSGCVLYYLVLLSRECLLEIIDQKLRVLKSYRQPHQAVFDSDCGSFPR